MHMTVSGGSARKKPAIASTTGREQTRVPLGDRADVPDPDARPREAGGQPNSPGDAIGEGVAGFQNDRHRRAGKPLSAPPRRPAGSRARSLASSRPPLPFCGCPTAPAADPVDEISADLFRSRELEDAEILAQAHHSVWAQATNRGLRKG